MANIQLPDNTHYGQLIPNLLISSEASIRRPEPAHERQPRFDPNQNLNDLESSRRYRPSTL